MSLNGVKYAEFASKLCQMQDLVENQQVDNPLDVAEIYRSLASLQNFFQTNIVTLAEIDGDTSGREQMYRTEMSKQMRLLEIDVSFLRNARQASTRRNRIQTISSRLSTLISYCQAASGEK